MKLLSKLSPAETLLIVENSSSSLKDLMKFTFMDLLLKRVLEIKIVHKKAHPRDKYIREYNYVVAGKNIEKYKPKEHELIYLSPYLKNKEISLLFRHVIKMGYEQTNGLSRYKKTIASSENIKQHFGTSFFQKIFGGQSLTVLGKTTKRKIVEFLDSTDADIADIIIADKKKALGILIFLGGNIFLLKNLDFQLLKKIDGQIIQEQKTEYVEGTNYYDDSWIYFDFYEDSYMFDSFFEGFNDTIDSFDTDFDAADCSSCDSGCSSCGGCGGCD